MSKLQADGLKKISVVFLKQQGYLPRGRSGTVNWTGYYVGNMGSAYLDVSTRDDHKYLRIQHTQKDAAGEERANDYIISFVTTRCHYGGKRFWFKCPNTYCGRRVGTLYLGGNYFGCRHCYNLTYNSRNESRRYRRFVSIPDLEKQEAKVGYPYYRGKPTKKYAKYLNMQDRFLRDMGQAAAQLGYK